MLWLLSVLELILIMVSLFIVSQKLIEIKSLRLQNSHQMDEKKQQLKV